MSSSSGQQDFAAFDDLSSLPPGQPPQLPRRPSNLSKMSSSSGQHDFAASDDLSSPPPGQPPLPSRRPSNLSKMSTSSGQQDFAAFDDTSPPSPGQRPLPSRRPSNLWRQSFPFGEDFATLDELSSSPPKQLFQPKLSNPIQRSLSLGQDTTTLDDELSTVPRQPSLLKLVNFSRKSSSLLQDFTSMTEELSLPSQQPSTLSTLGPPLPFSAQNLPLFGSVSPSPSQHPSMRKQSPFLALDGSTHASFPHLTTPVDKTPLVPGSQLMRETPMMTDSFPPFESDSSLEHLASSPYPIKSPLVQDLVLGNPSSPSPKPPIRRRASFVGAVAGQAPVRSKIKRQASMIDLLMSGQGQSTTMVQAPSLSASKSSLLPDLVLGQPSCPGPKPPVRMRASCVIAVEGQASVRSTIKRRASMIDLLMAGGGQSTPTGQAPSLLASKYLVPDLVLDSPSSPGSKPPIRRRASCVGAVAGQASVLSTVQLRRASMTNLLLSGGGQSPSLSPTIMDKPPPRRQASMKQVIGRWQASQPTFKPEQMLMGGHVQHAPSSSQGSSSTCSNRRQRGACGMVGSDGEAVYKEPLPKHRRSWISVYRTYMQMADDRRVQKAALVTCHPATVGERL
eukprot:gene19355-26004_t